MSDDDARLQDRCEHQTYRLGGSFAALLCIVHEHFETRLRRCRAVRRAYRTLSPERQAEFDAAYAEIASQAYSAFVTAGRHVESASCGRRDLILHRIGRLELTLFGNPETRSFMILHFRFETPDDGPDGGGWTVDGLIPAPGAPACADYVLWRAQSSKASIPEDASPATRVILRIFHHDPGSLDAYVREAQTRLLSEYDAWADGHHQDRLKMRNKLIH